MTLHPASHNTFVEINEECDSPGTIYASVILFGIQGISKSPTWVKHTRDPAGNLIATGFSATLKFTIGTPSTRKCAVAPESEMANSTCLVIFFL